MAIQRVQVLNFQCDVCNKKFKKSRQEDTIYLDVLNDNGLDSTEVAVDFFAYIGGVDDGYICEKCYAKAVELLYKKLQNSSDVSKS